MLKRIIDTRTNVVIKGRHGYSILNKNDINIGQTTQQYGEYSESEVELFRHVCKPGDVVMDVGANMGLHTLALSRIVGETGHVLCFEPQRILFQMLCGSLALNSIENVDAFQVATGAEAGHIFIPNFDYSKTNNFGSFGLNKFKSGQKVPMICLDEFCNEISSLKFIKIDIEGMESQAISGSKKLITKFKPFLYVENDRVQYSKELIEIIWSLGYQVYWHKPKLFNPQNYAKNLENNVFVNTVSLNMLCVHDSIKQSITGLKKITDSSLHPLNRTKHGKVTLKSQKKRTL